MDNDLDDHLDDHSRRMERLRPTPVVVALEDLSRRSSTDLAVEQTLNALASSLVDSPTDYVKEMEAYLGIRFSTDSSSTSGTVADLPLTPRLAVIPASTTPPRPHPSRSAARRQFRHSPPDVAEPSVTSLQDAARVGAGLGDVRSRNGRTENGAAVLSWNDGGRFGSPEHDKEELSLEAEEKATEAVVYTLPTRTNGPFDPASQLELRNGTEGCAPAGAPFRGPVPGHFSERAMASGPDDIDEPDSSVTSDSPQPVFLSDAQLPARKTGNLSAQGGSPIATTSGANMVTREGNIVTRERNTVTREGNGAPLTSEPRPDDDMHSYDDDDDDDDDDLDSGVSADDPISEIRRLRQKWRAAVREAEVHGAAATSSYQALREKERLLEVANEKVAEISDGMRRLKEEFRLQRRADTDKLAWAKRLVARTEKARDALETEVAALKGETETREQNLLLLKRRVKAERNRARQLENQLNESQLESERYWSQVQLLRRLLGMCLCIAGILALRLFSGPRAVHVNVPLNLDDPMD